MMKIKYSIKQILTSNQAWWRFYNNHKHKLRHGILVAITKLLSCKNIVRGYHEYSCSNPDCHHIKRVPHTCKSKACSSCGKKATDLWIHKQHQILPRTSWQHITFTMPSELWDFFWCNRHLLNHIAKCAADSINAIALFRKIHRQKPLIIPNAIQKQLNPLFTFNHFLNRLYKKHWIVDCAKP